MSDKTYTSKEFAEQMGIEKHTLRFYEKHGLFKVHRDTNGYRIYDEQDFSDFSVFLAWLSTGLSVKDAINNVQFSSIDNTQKKLNLEFQDLEYEQYLLDAKKQKINFYNYILNWYKSDKFSVKELTLSDFYNFPISDNLIYLHGNEISPILYHGVYHLESSNVSYIIFEDSRLKQSVIKNSKKIHLGKCKAYLYSYEKNTNNDLEFLNKDVLDLYLMFNVDELPSDLCIRFEPIK